jgi:two-component system sensor histidine kinase VicK
LVGVYNGKEFVPKDKDILRNIFKDDESLVFSAEQDIFFEAGVDKNKRPVAAVVTLLRDKSAAVMMFRDITEEKQLNEARDHFVALASHQLRTPLTSIRWYAEMLEDVNIGALNELQKEFVGRIHTGSLKLDEMINMLLALAKIESQQMADTYANIDLKHFIQTVVDDAAAIVKYKQTEVSILTKPEKIEPLMLQEIKLRQVISNLLSNAVQYSPVGGKVGIMAEMKGGAVEVTVKDSGIGIPSAEQPKIFTKFFRASNAMKTRPDGSGLGLALVKELVLSWGGNVWFETEEGKGTIFHFTIPIKKE